MKCAVVYHLFGVNQNIFSISHHINIVCTAPLKLRPYGAIEIQLLYYLTFFNLPHPATATATATATTATASRLRSQKLHIVLWGLHVGLVL